ncbi:3-isopropylmalate dehydrogenase [Fusibacter bizertensis]
MDIEASQYHTIKGRKYKIAVLSGDGIGPEVVGEAVKVLKHVGDRFKINFEFKHALIGGAAIDHEGEAFPKNTLETCQASDAVLLGSVGGTKWDDLPGEKRPEKALLALRKGLNLYANIRPAIMYEALKGACPLKAELVPSGFDICVVRELTGGIYFGERGTRVNATGFQEAYDIETYSTEEIRRIGLEAFEIATKRNKKIVSVDKANVLESSRLWRKEMDILSEKYPEVTLEHMYVDNAAMQLIKNPSQFDVIVTSNMFGDILSDEASMLTGSIGMLPSASLGSTKLGLYEPIHGSAPDIAGLDIANPIATILSAAMMLRHSFELYDEANAIESAVEHVLKAGYRTVDIFEPGKILLGTIEMGNQIVKVI